MTRIFISYKRPDNEIFAERIRKQLEAWDIETWIDTKDISDGAYWPDEFKRGLINSEVLLGIVSEHTFESRRVREQWDWAIEQNKRIIALLIETPNKVPQKYFHVERVDFSDGESKGFSQLKEKFMIQQTKPSKSNNTVSNQNNWGEEAIVEARSPFSPNPTWRSTIFIASLLLSILTGVWFINRPDYEPLVAFLGSVVGMFGSFTASNEPLSVIRNVQLKLRANHRQKTIRKVRASWIEGVLKPSLHSGSMDISLQIKPDAVLKHKDYGDYDLPENPDILQIFEDMNRELLILGAPGAGKTTLMLQLAEKLLDRAEVDKRQPIPVVFNLSSWAAKEETLYKWLQERLRQEYKLRRGFIWELLNNPLILLLDGLDEVREISRGECIAEINKFRHDHNWIDIAVCSRVEEYERLTTQLDLRGAIILQPLSDAEIDFYLNKPGLENIREIVKSNPKIREMAETPFLLNVIVFVYQNVSNFKLNLETSQKDFTSNLFTKYIKKLHFRNPKYPLSKTNHYLEWLAFNMNKRNISIFAKSDLDFKFINTQIGQKIHKLGLIIIFFLVICFLYIYLYPLPLIGAGTDGNQVATSSRLFSIFSACIIISIVFRELGFTFARWTDRKKPMSITPATPLPKEAREALEATVVKLKKSKYFRYGINLSFLLSIFTPVLLSLVFIRFGFFSGILTSFSLGYIVRKYFPYNLLANLLLLPKRSKPLAILAILGLGLSLGIFVQFDTFTSLFSKQLSHLILYRDGHIPWNYAKFLDYCAEIGLLRKVGGGYIFVHRYLLEYFAGLEEERP